MSGARNRPAARKPVAIQNSALWMCQVRTSAVREPLRHVDAVEGLALHRVVRGEAAEHDLED
jgi:hypothetical protein